MYKKKNILIISYDFYPEELPNTFRWLNIAQKWVDRGDNVVILSANKGGFSEYEIINGIEIYRTGEYFIGQLKYKNRNLIRSNSAPKIKYFNFKKIIRQIYDITWSKFYWPDHSFLWYFTGKKKALELVHEKKIDVVVSVSWMFSAHLIGRYLKLKFPTIFWLADSVDPFYINRDINNSKLFGRLNKIADKKIFNDADQNVVLTETIKQEYLKTLKVENEKLTVIPNIFVPSDFNFFKKPKDNYINFLYLGSLNLKFRNPKFFLDFFYNYVKKNPLKHVRLDVYGDISDCYPLFEEYSELLNKNIFINGIVSKDEINNIIKNADVLINIGNANRFQEPSKLVEYIFSGKKILNFHSIQDDASSVLLRNYNNALNIFGKVTSELNYPKITDFLNSTKTFDRNYIDNFLQDYYLDSIEKTYRNLISKK